MFTSFRVRVGQGNALAARAPGAHATYPNPYPRAQEATDDWGWPGHERPNGTAAAAVQPVGVGWNRLACARTAGGRTLTTEDRVWWMDGRGEGVPADSVAAMRV